MPADTFAWLHLTDLHLGLKGQGWLWPTLRQPFLDDLALLHQHCGPWDAVLFTGDLVQSGQSAQFQGLQEQVLGPLWERLARLGSGDAVLVAVPGNHDLFRPNAAQDNAAIDALLDPDQFPRVAAKFWDQPDGGYRRVVNHAFAAWRDWWAGAPHRPARIATGALPGDLAVTIAKGERRIGFMGLNTAFLQLGAGDYRGKLVWDPRQVDALCPDGIDRWHEDHDFRLLLTHQGPDWLTPEARALGDTEIAPAGRFALHLFGHMHEVLAALVHFSEPAPLPWLLPLTTLSPTAARTALDDLRDRSLLLTDDDRGTWLLPALAARYLRRVRPEVVAATGERLAERAYALAQENGDEQHDRFPTLEAAWPELAAALPVLIGGDNRRLQGFCDALQHFLNFSGRWDDWLALSLAAESRALAADDHDNAGRRAYDAGWCHLPRRNAEGVLDCAGRAAAHWQQANAAARERAAAIRLRGEGYRLAKDYPAAIATLREALALWRGLSPRSREVTAGLSSLADALRDSGQYDDAEGYYREALAIARDLPDPEGVAIYTGNVAELAADRKDWPAAERLAREALALDASVGRKDLIAADCQWLAKALARQGRGAEGRCHAERAVALFTELRSPDLAEAQAILAECRS